MHIGLMADTDPEDENSHAFDAGTARVLRCHANDTIDREPDATKATQCMGKYQGEFVVRPGYLRVRRHRTRTAPAMAGFEIRRECPRDYSMVRSGQCRRGPGNPRRHGRIAGHSDLNRLFDHDPRHTAD